MKSCEKFCFSLYLHTLPCLVHVALLDHLGHLTSTSSGKPQRPEPSWLKGFLRAIYAYKVEFPTETPILKQPAQWLESHIQGQSQHCLVCKPKQFGHKWFQLRYKPPTNCRRKAFGTSLWAQTRQIGQLPWWKCWARFPLCLLQ